MLPVRRHARRFSCLVVLGAAACAPAVTRPPPAPVAKVPRDPAPEALRVATPAPASAAMASPVATGTEEDAPPASAGIARDGGLSPRSNVATPPEPAALPEGTTVLQIGDSFAGALGIDLNRELKDEGIRGVLKYETSTYIPTWASNKDLDRYLNRYHPDLVLITLGANELQIPAPAERAPTIHRLVNRLGGRSCVWVAPPLWEGARPALLKIIRANCAPCVYLDSSALVPDLQRMKDHIHPSMEGRRIWAKAVLDWLREHRDPHGSRPWDMMP